MAKKKAIPKQPEFKIEKGIPMPATNSVYPFASMEVGDSFAVPIAQHKHLVSASQNYRRRHGKEVVFSIRRVDDETQVRIWRME